VSNQQIQKVKVKRLAHVGLWATDVLTQARFYRQVLGLDLRLPPDNAVEQDTETGDAGLFLALGDEYHCLGLFNDTRPAPGNGRRSARRTQLHHLAFAVDIDDELAALAARLKISGVELTMSPRDGDSDAGDTLWFNDPDGNRIEILVPPDDVLARTTATSGERYTSLRPLALQHVALHTPHLDTMVEFYSEALGFDISDWLLREAAWLRCNHNHHTLMLIQESKQDVDHVGYSISDGQELLRWGDHLSRQHVPILWGPGRHGAGSDLFLRFADSEGLHIELSAGLEQYYDHDVTSPPRLWHTRALALNLWGAMPSWMREEIQV